MLHGSPLLLTLSLALPPLRGELAATPPPGASHRWGGVVGQRLEANLQQWLLAAPEANPGWLEMFRRRDRQPPPDLLPWSGEFLGKFQVSAIACARLHDSPALSRQIDDLFEELAGCQDPDGYLGPWPRAERLRGQWDLWGHYHLLSALLDWHEATGSTAALAVARRIGNCCVAVFDGERRVLSAGSPEMNMAILTGLLRLHRLTGEPAYLALAREVERDWQSAGDYLRAGLANTPFYRTPRPRWESLHCLQGLLELFRLTGDADYRTALLNLWHSIRALDVHHTGGFTTGEQAVGDPYAGGAIETCCTVAWMALTADVLHLTADPRAADELERSCYNAGLGAQHPSGRWWTYNTPMDGVRKASAHDIVFQARPGTPELNCCSVNGPRVLGLLGDWAVLRDAAGLPVSYYGPGESRVSLADGTAVRLTQVTDYPCQPQVTLTVHPARPVEFALRLRIPGWSQRTLVIAGDQVLRPAAGQWLALRRTWQAGDTVRLAFDFGLRRQAGEGACAGRVALWRGPLLLAWDQRHNRRDEAELPTLDGADLQPREVAPNGPAPRPWVLLEVGPADRRVLLCDFASAGAAGNPYRSWLPASGAGPGEFSRLEPAEEAVLPPGPVVLQWGPPAVARPLTTVQRLVIATDPTAAPLHELRPELPAAQVELPAGRYCWQVVRTADGRDEVCRDGWGWFTVQPGARPQAAQLPPPLRLRDDGALVAAALAGDPTPQWGELAAAQGWQPSSGPAGAPDTALQLGEPGSQLRYRFAYLPAGDFSALAWFRLDSWPTGRIAQVLSLWCQSGDDPLRLTIDGQRLHLRTEGFWSQPTAGVAITLGRWYHIAGVRQGPRLRLYVDGQLASETACAATGPSSATTQLGVGCNPLFGGDERLPGAAAAAALYARALTAAEVAAAAGR
ncbi:MAG: glycoside hydrolase family 127 protein [Fimbriimonadaceae bacterium]|nr:glycoside hydrolase family 127 protein [Fimbriimonadaceae bacterium]